MSKTDLTVTVERPKLMDLLRERVADVDNEHKASIVRYEAKMAKLREQQAAYLRKLADGIESGKGELIHRYRDLPEALYPPAKPAKKAECRAKTLLAQVSASSQETWRISTEMWVGLFGEACEL